MKLTDKALDQFKKMVESDESFPSGIRFYTVQGCCSPRLQMEIVPAPREGDVVVKIGDVDFFFTPEADEILSNITIDFSDGVFRTI